jgi:hypothetical protein
MYGFPCFVRGSSTKGRCVSTDDGKRHPVSPVSQNPVISSPSATSVSATSRRIVAVDNRMSGCVATSSVTASDDVDIDFAVGWYSLLHTTVLDALDDICPLLILLYGDIVVVEFLVLGYVSWNARLFNKHEARHMYRSEILMYLRICFPIVGNISLFVEGVVVVGGVGHAVV